MVTTVQQTSPPITAQLNYRQMTSELLQWNPDLDPLSAGRMINNSFRRILDFRRWYGCVLHGVLQVPTMYSAGTATFTAGSQTVTGVGTAWNVTMVGLQIRVGFSTPTYTITAVGSPTSLTIDLPWAPQTMTNAGYQIFMRYASFGPNIKQLLVVINQFQGYRMKLHIPQEALNRWDAWRATVGFTYAIADYTPSQDSQPMYELYPIPITQQGFPFLAYTQPPDFVNDGDAPPLWIRSDVVVLGALPDALLFRGKKSAYYDPATAKFKSAQFAEELQKMGRNDDNSAMRGLIWEYSRYPMSRFGSSFLQAHDVGDDSFD